MAQYHLRVKVISRKSGGSAPEASAYRSGSAVTGSAVKASAYRACERLCDNDGVIHDYSRKSDVVHTEIMTPDNAPAWCSDRSTLWNTVETFEKRKDAQLAREVEVMLPRELTPEQRLDLVREFVGKEFISKGMIADIAIHCHKATDGKDHPHAHVLLTMRTLGGDGTFEAKKPREWNSKDTLNHWRKSWAEHANKALEQHGHMSRIDHRTLTQQGKTHDPQLVRGKVGNTLYKQQKPFIPSQQIAREKYASKLEDYLFNVMLDVAQECGIAIAGVLRHHRGTKQPPHNQTYQSTKKGRSQGLYEPIMDWLMESMGKMWDIYQSHGDKTSQKGIER